jgi:hypothetical protein
MSPPSPLFISSKFSISGSLPTSSNRLNRQAHCSGRLTFQIRIQFLAARAFLGVLRPPICKPKSATEERNKAPAHFRMATLRLSFLFVYVANRITAPFHFTSASHTPPCYEHRLLGLGGAALAHTGLSFVSSGPASSSFLL